MDSITYQKFIEWLLLRFKIWAPKKNQKQTLYSKINHFSEIDSEEKPFYSLRSLLFPCPEKIFKFKNNKYQTQTAKTSKVILNIPLYDLEAYSRYTQIFAQDPYFQNRVQNTLIFGASKIPDATSFYPSPAEKMLKYLKFDLYFDQNSDGTFNLFTGSEKGQKILENFGNVQSESINYQGISPNNSKQNQNLKQKIIASRESKFWEDLANQCLACGKCTLVCPMCYCYDLKTASDGNVSREWGNCFYSEFSKISGNQKILKNIQDRIYNWYEHKFVRMPTEYGFTGCVQCGRCTETCPAKINIQKNLDQINKFSVKEKT